MEILKPLTRPIQLDGAKLDLHISTLTNNNSEVVVTASYKQKRFSQYFRREDFGLKRGESLLFLKLLLSEV
jgi:hypothetical protein